MGTCTVCAYIIEVLPEGNNLLEDPDHHERPPEVLYC